MQAMIDLANQKALARLEEIDRWVSNRTLSTMPTVQYVEFMATVTKDELNAYLQWCDTKLQMMSEKPVEWVAETYNTPDWDWVTADGLKPAIRDGVFYPKPKGE